MFVRMIVPLLILPAMTSMALSQTVVATDTKVEPAAKVGDLWRSTDSRPLDTSPVATPIATPVATPAKTVDDGIAPRDAAPPESTGGRRTIARVTKGNGTLPNEHGQVWREYDISPYTLRVISTNKPEQAVVDWILRETGYETWHGEPLGILSATKRTLRVYHTPEVQEAIADIVDRFVNSEAETQAFSLRVITVQNPNWRATEHELMQPVEVQSPGVQAWLMAKEDAALLLAKMRKRNDFREHSSPHLMINNGQSTVISAWRSRDYIKDVVMQTQPRPALVPEKGTIEEGFSLEFTPLLSVDGGHVEAILKANIDQVEKMVPVVLDFPAGGAQRHRFKVDVPQMTNARLHEKFRWPIDKVLVISRGVVATPVPGQTVVNNPLNLPTLNATPPRADALVFIQNKGQVADAAEASRRRGRTAGNYRGRY